MTIKDLDLGYRQLIKDLANLETEIAVYVGYPANEVDADIIVRASANEFGTEDGRIPERSFLRSEVDENRKEYADLMTSAAASAARGGNIRRELSIVGEIAVGNIQTRMTNLSDPPNKPSTVAEKGTDNPLIDSSIMRNSLTYEVK